MHSVIHYFKGQSLRARLTLGVLLAVVLALWITAFTASYVLRQDMQKTIADQQLSAVSVLANNLDQAMNERLAALQALAPNTAAVMARDTRRVQGFLEQGPLTQHLFNWGLVVVDDRGLAIASIPTHLGRQGTHYGELPFIQKALRNGQPLITDPMIGKRTKQPVFSMVVPIKNPEGKVIGLLMGATNLQLPNFLDTIAAAKYGRTGDFLVTAPESRVFVTSSDKQRVMKSGPPRGVNPVFDRYLDGYEGSGMAVSSRGVLELSSSKRIPASGWLMQSVLPAEEAMAPVNDTVRHIVFVSLLLTALFGFAAWWWLRRELSPLREAAGLLTAMQDGAIPRQYLPIRREDEIGELAKAFNGLLESILVQEAQAAEHAANERLRKIVAHVPGIVFQYRLNPDGNGYFPFISDACQEIYGIPTAELEQSAASIRHMMHPDDGQGFLESLFHSARTMTPWRAEYRICMPEGRIKWLLVDALPESSVGDSVTWCGFVADITQTKAMEAELQIAAAAFLAQEGIMVTDTKARILRVNPAFEETTGYRNDEVLGHTPRILQSGRHDALFYKTLWDQLRATGHWQGEVWNKRKNGEIYPELLTITALKNIRGETTHYVGTFLDITARKAAEEDIRNLAFFDPLTRLPNRRLLLDRLQRSILNNDRSHHHGALLFLDLDNFKTLNDTLGHAMGDQLLVKVAGRLQHCVREGDTVARLGGDEFVVMLEGLDADRAVATTQAEQVGVKVVKQLGEIYFLGEHSHRSSASIGITLFNGREANVEEVLKQADMAMYQAKAAGRNTMCFFNPAMQSLVAARSALESELYLALENDEFRLHYQPQLDTQGRCVGVEALIRWFNGTRGLVSPGSFIPLAEATGLIFPIGHWVLQEACKRLLAWQANPLTRDLVMAVNVSAMQFRLPTFAEELRSLLENTGANPQRLKLEITESMLLTDVDDIIVKMTTLRDLGVSFSLDDFGTGYSSLAYLKRLPLNQMKIDQSFVRDVLTTPNDAAICRAVIAMAKSLGLDVIAEGVETQCQWDFLLAEGCDKAQGYLYAKPLPEDELMGWLADHQG